MLVSVLLLVLAAGGVLMGAVVSDHTQWAWVSVLLCAVCVVLLALQRSRSRWGASSPTRGTPAAEPAGEGGAPAVQERTALFDDAAARQAPERSPETRAGAQEARAGAHRARAGAQETPPVPQEAPAVPQEARTVPSGASGRHFRDDFRDDFRDEEPGDEGTDAAVLLQGDELDVRVLVVDERPRYHLDSCGWLGNRPTVPVSLRQARSLGFTPCALCAPNAVLTTKARAARRSLSSNGPVASNPR